MIDKNKLNLPASPVMVLMAGGKLVRKSSQCGLIITFSTFSHSFALMVLSCSFNISFSLSMHSLLDYKYKKLKKSSPIPDFN